MRLMLAEGKLPFVYGASDNRPEDPRLGQPVFEEDTGMVVVWDGTLWRPVSTAGIRAFKQAGSNTSPAYPGPNLVATLNIPDPGYPYFLMAWGQIFLRGGTAGDEWDVSLSGSGITIASHIVLNQVSFGGPAMGYGGTGMDFVSRTGASALTLSYTAGYGGLAAQPEAPALSGDNRISALIVPS